MGKALELTGQKFGKLLVLEKTNNRTKDGLIKWKCQCDCGNIVEVAGSYLKKGNTKSCGCNNALKRYNEQQSEKNKIPLGTKYRKLTVIQDLGFRNQIEGHRRRWYLCQCECGEFKEVMGNLLKTGQVSSCGHCNLNSNGEFTIIQLLQKNNILFEHDKAFSELSSYSGRTLRFDFIIYNSDGSINRFIEFDGEQHFYGPDTNYWGHTTDTLSTIQERDNLKNNFCLKNNYILVRIPFYHLPHLTLNDLMGEEYVVKE